MMTPAASEATQAVACIMTRKKICRQVVNVKTISLVIAQNELNIIVPL